MWRLLAAVKRSLGWRNKGSKVVDESALGAGEGDGLIGLAEHDQEAGRGPLTALLAVVCAPLAALSCFTGHAGDGAGDVWLSGELRRASEMDFLMVRDSMRYAIYV